MFENILKKLEDPKRPLLGPNVKALKFWGLWLPENIVKRYYYLILHLLFTIFIATIYVDLYLIKNDMDLVMNNGKITLMSTTTICKTVTFLLWQRYWISTIEYVTRADAIQRNSDDVAKKNIITKYTEYCRKITYLFWSLTFVTATILVLTPVFKYFLSATNKEIVKNGTEEYTLVMRAWVPFDKNTISGYLAVSVYQVSMVIIGGSWAVIFDTCVMAIMVFFKQELELLRIDSSNIYGTEKEPVTDDEAKERLKDVHKRHLELVKFARIFDSCLSPVMLMYLFVCSIMMCFTAYQITTETSAMQRILISEYLFFSVAQLFIYCFHSNEVLYTSQDLLLGPYEGTWWTTDAKKRKDLYILVAQFKEILKGAYSYYTLLSKSQNK